RAKSDRAKERALADLREHCLQRAIQIYTERQAEGQGSSSPPLSLDDARKQAEAECLAQKKKIVKLSKATLARRVKGGRSTREAHEEQKWLTSDEERVVIHAAIDYANRGFPLSHRRLKEHVDEI
ncbi:hypothetical protein B0H16DRAFT_1241617, partial [Mycena metata]